KQTPLEAITSFSQKPTVLEKKKVSPASFSLSYYQIDDYLTCPLKYKYVHMLYVPIMEHHTVIYGKAMHSAVTSFFQYKLAGKKMTLKKLLEKFEKEFRQEGFLDKRHYLERLKAGKFALKEFYEREKEDKNKILFIEKDFAFSFDNIKITGRFDRVDMEEDGAVIFDFKTSDVSNQEEANEKTKDSLQLCLYSFAYQNIFGSMPKKACLYFLESGIIGETEFKEKDIEKLKEKIRRVIQGIQEQDFSAQPQYLACNYCAYNRICPEASMVYK
ncbi:MAG: PD-(D/E)XK nuclease family protein, partial [Candidatus Omnitrophica bacterium]|nr:PD-(D/E)XK nuclease family protein [Candidatus Omnitrophota bacterium]